MDTNSAFFAYGVYVGSDLDEDETQRIDDVLATIKDQSPDVRCVFGGYSDGERIFLVAHSKGVEPGEYCDATDISPEQQAGWTDQLAHATQVLGYTDLKRPSWLCYTVLD